MKITPQLTEKILRGNQSFSQFGFSMLITRLKKLYAKDPSESTLQACTSEINKFLDKFKMIMADDYVIITKL